MLHWDGGSFTFIPNWEGDRSLLAKHTIVMFVLTRSCPYPLWHEKKSSYLYSVRTSFEVRQTLNDEQTRLQPDGVAPLTQHEQIQALFHVAYIDRKTKSL